MVDFFSCGSLVTCNLTSPQRYNITLVPLTRSGVRLLSEHTTFCAGSRLSVYTRPICRPSMNHDGSFPSKHTNFKKNHYNVKCQIVLLV